MAAPNGFLHVDKYKRFSCGTMNGLNWAIYKSISDIDAHYLAEVFDINNDLIATAKRRTWKGAAEWVENLMKAKEAYEDDGVYWLVRAVGT